MKIAVIHGYSLADTGSNIFVANLAAGLADRGHEVFLICQEPKPEKFDFIDECYDFGPNNRQFFEVFRRRGQGRGPTRMFRPNIGKILPVFVLDDYMGFIAREFQRLPRADIDKHISDTAEAVKTIYRDFGFETALANHLIASPAVARRALEPEEIPYHVAIHGSALNYSVKTNRILDAPAIYGLSGATSINASSDFLGKQLNDYLSSLNLPPVKVGTIYPGAELSLFKPVLDRAALMSDLARELDAGNCMGKSAELKKALRTVVGSGRRKAIMKEIEAPGIYDRRSPDRDLPEMLDKIGRRNEQIIIFAGKYLAAKGLHATILAAPIVLSRLPKARFLAVGFSDDRELFEALLASLATEQGDLVVELVEMIEASATPKVGGDFIEELKKNNRYRDYLSIAAKAGLPDRFMFTGPLDHRHLARLLAAADITISPSVFPEAFGMVAVEALAAGVYPIVTDEFGMAEIARVVAANTREFWSDQPQLRLDDRFVTNLSNIITAAIKKPDLRKPEFKRAAHNLAVKRYSWDRVVAEYADLFERRGHVRAAS